jgi:hypothetical protein
MAATPDGGGYWLVASDGGVFSFGDAGFYGSTGGKALDTPVVGMAPPPTAVATGWWPPTAGSSASATPGSTARWEALPSVKPVVGMAPPPPAVGYWLVAADGGVFSFGDAGFYGSRGTQSTEDHFFAICASPGGEGYLLAGDQAA